MLGGVARLERWVLVIAEVLEGVVRLERRVPEVAAVLRRLGVDTGGCGVAWRGSRAGAVGNGGNGGVWRASSGYQKPKQC